MTGARAVMLADGRRLHLHHGPIDLIIEAFGEPKNCHRAYRQAFARFQTILAELAAELPVLRRPLRDVAAVESPVARRMADAVVRHPEVFVTPMAAVAGAVADEIRDALVADRWLDKAYVNNGGDAAIFLAAGASLDLALAVEEPDGWRDAGRAHLRAEDAPRGLATSGWRGRSQSLGIADAVTVIAHTAAAADVAATLIANAVDLPDHPAITRCPASDLSPDSDLGDRLVTTDVGPLSQDEIDRALRRGVALADEILGQGTIVGAALFLGGTYRLVGEGGNFSVGQGVSTLRALDEAVG